MKPKMFKKGEIVMSLDVSLFYLLNLHHRMLSDEIRTKAFQKAIFEKVNPGDVVVDIGTGTGILAFFAIQAGAKKVYAIDTSNIIEVAKQIARDNRILDKIVFIQNDSREVVLPEKADIIISETIGSFGLEENICGTLLHGKQNFLKPGGKIIPEEIELYLTPVFCEGKLENIKWEFLKNYDINNDSLSDIAVHNTYKTNLIESNIVSCPKLISKINFTNIEQISYVFKTQFNLQNCKINGLGGWFKAKLSSNVYIDTSPFSSPTHWMQTYFPLQEVVEAFKDKSTIEVEIRNHPFGNSCFIEWNIRTSVREYHHTTFNGLPSIERFFDMYGIS
ncbi:MAG: type protein arginine methyltransferase [Candidatus Petromonas sp.]|jgi:predicted RNA methylase|nr:type protein arginine methyltransferase [Candidatus Petromonas sp.]